MVSESGVSSATAGDEVCCLSRWVAQYGDALLGFFRSRFRCEETAADLAQETLLRVHAYTRKTQARDLQALTFSIARRVAVDQRRRQAWRARHETVAPFLDAVPYEAPGLDDAVIAEEAWRHVQQSLCELPVDCRTAFVLSSFHGRTYAQIAQRLGVSECMVAKHVARALRHCRAVLGSS
ncbi:MAG: RNA polymerase sigma factor [Gammaproteobacteria bacterium]